MAKRYSKEDREKVINFVSAYDKKNGRGGKSAAAKKFGVNTNSIRNWLSSSDAPKAKAKAGKPRRAKCQKTESPVGKVSNIQMLEKMIQIQNQISGLQAEFEDLRSNLSG